MFGKYFSSTFTGSMVGSGLNVFALWGYIIANTDVNGYIELNPPVIAAMMGCSPDEIETAIAFLMSPDPKSRNKKHEGKRLIQKASFLYFVPNYSEYHAIRDTKDRREYMKNYMRDYRSISKANKDGGGKDVNCLRKQSKLVLAHTDIDTDIDIRVEELRSSSAETSSADSALASPPENPNDKPASKSSKKTKRARPTFEQWFESLRTEETYAHVNLDHQLGLAKIWIRDHPGRQLSQQFFRNWINKIDPALVVEQPTAPPMSEDEILARAGMEASKKLFYELQQQQEERRLNSQGGIQP